VFLILMNLGSTCGTGMQYRTLKCVQRLSSLLFKELSKEHCKDLTIPELKRPCEVMNCSYWKIEKWQPCGVTCGRGSKIRNVTCVNKFEISVHETLCIEKKPATVEICDMGSCARVWFYSNWSGDCDELCERDAFITRKAVCGGNILEIKNKNSNSNCDIKSMKETKKSCKTNLSKCQSKWFVGPWNECSVSCNEGIRKRMVICLIDAKSKWIPTDESFCNPKEKPNSFEKCKKESCKSEWYMSDWSEVKTF
jgi:hypothetical protein